MIYGMRLSTILFIYEIKRYEKVIDRNCYIRGSILSQLIGD
jgi:hypothetical protein